MDFLKKEYLESVPVKIENRNIEIGGYTFTIIEILESITRPEEGETAYTRDYNRWLIEDWKTERLDFSKEILRNYSNQARFNDLCAAATTNVIVPFIGAGLSVPSGMLTWENFLRSLQPQSNIGIEEFNRMLTIGAYEDVATAILTQIGVHLFNEQVEHTFKLPEGKEILGPVRFLPELFRITVVTTNFDNILESLYELRDKKFDQYLHGKEIEDYRQYRGRGQKCLLKIHGDFLKPRSRVLTSDEYNQFYAKTSGAKQELELLFQNHPILFLGCKLTNDRTSQLLQALCISDPNMQPHYAFLKDPGDIARRERDISLARSKIFPIWYQGDHDSSIEALLIAMMDKIGIL